MKLATLVLRKRIASEFGASIFRESDFVVFAAYAAQGICEIIRVQQPPRRRQKATRLS